MPTSLRSALSDLAESFANGVLAALLAEGGGAPGRRPAPRRVQGTDGGKPGPFRAPTTKKTRNRRLARRSQADIGKTLAQVVALVKTKKTGLRSEEIRKALKLDRREVPRVLKQGISSKKLRARGQKRATTYFAA
jgi:hypothetical protein